MTIRTVEQSPYVMAQGEPIAPNTGKPFSRPFQNHFSGYIATVRTGPTTTATGRLIESERKSDE